MKLVVSVGAVFVCMAVVASHAPAAGYDQWRKLPYPPGRADYFKDIGLEEGDVLWVTAGTTIAYWDGTRFREPANLEFISGKYFNSFYGGPDRGLYSIRKATKSSQLYRLTDGQAVYVADLYSDSPRNPPAFYVARSGTLFNWGENFLAVFTGDSWKYLEGTLDTVNPLIFDNGRSVYFFHAGKPYGVEGKDRVSRADLPIEFPNRRPMIKGALWGDDRAIFLAYSGQGIKAANLATAEILDTASINKAFGDRTVYDLFSAPDGAVWVLANDQEARNYVLMRVAPDGTVERISAVAGLPFDNHQFMRSPHSVCFASDGALWFGLHDAPLAHMEHDRVRQFGRVGLDLSRCTKLLEDGRGRIYAVAFQGVYVTAPDSLGSLADLPEPQPPKIFEEVAWKVEVGKRVSLGPNHIAATRPDSRGLSFFDPASGERVASLDVPGLDQTSTWLAPAGQPHQVEVLAPKEFQVVDASEGRVDLQIDYPFDPRVMPLQVGSDFFAAKGPRSRELVLLDVNGNEKWSCSLPGYVQSQLAACGAFGVVQTRGSSYGGQKTLGVDLNNGEVLWSDTTDAYGYGAVFADDTEYVVEAVMWLSPPATEGRLLCHEVRTGERRWEYARPGTISHCPALDLRTDRLYAVFDRGEVVCLEGPTGKLIWEATLPECPYPAGNPSYDPASSAIAIQEDYVLVVDSCWTLHVFRAGDGERVAEYDLMSAFRDSTTPQRPARLLCMPRLYGRLLVVATDFGLAAYPVAETLGLQ